MENFKLEELKIFGQPLTQEFILESYQVSLYTFLMLVVLEVYSWDNVWRKTAEKEANWALYIKAMWTNAEHYLVYGPVAYAIVSAYVKSTGSFYPSYISLPGVLMVQAIGYACAHAWMHRSENYWIHKFHHSFSEQTFIRPISANTVTTTEFLIAYAFPIVVGVAIFKPNVETARNVTLIISATNLLIHTPSRVLPMDAMPSWLVTNLKHFHHHEKDVRRHYSAPILDLDSVLGLVNEPSAAKKK